MKKTVNIFFNLNYNAFFYCNNILPEKTTIYNNMYGQRIFNYKFGSELQFNKKSLKYWFNNAQNENSTS